MSGRPLGEEEITEGINISGEIRFDSSVAFIFLFFFLANIGGKLADGNWIQHQSSSTGHWEMNRGRSVELIEDGESIHIF